MLEMQKKPPEAKPTLMSSRLSSFLPGATRDEKYNRSNAGFIGYIFTMNLSLAMRVGSNREMF